MSKATRVLKKQIASLQIPDGVTARHTDDTLCAWEGVLHGPAGTPFAGGRFAFTINFPAGFPFDRPAIRLSTPICHPNVVSDHANGVLGTVRLSLMENWSPKATLTVLFESLIGILRAPDGIDQDRAQAWTRAYASDPPDDDGVYIQRTSWELALLAESTRASQSQLHANVANRAAVLCAHGAAAYAHKVADHALSLIAAAVESSLTKRLLLFFRYFRSPAAASGRGRADAAPPSLPAADEAQCKRDAQDYAQRFHGDEPTLNALLRGEYRCCLTDFVDLHNESQKEKGVARRKPPSMRRQVSASGYRENASDDDDDDDDDSDGDGDGDGGGGGGGGGGDQPALAAKHRESGGGAGGGRGDVMLESVPREVLRGCHDLTLGQTQALLFVRAHAKQLHFRALPQLRERVRGLGMPASFLDSMLRWVREEAPIVVHVPLEKTIGFFEKEPVLGGVLAVCAGCVCWLCVLTARAVWRCGVGAPYTVRDPLTVLTRRRR
jgi:ubiquitin-protein ligase